MQQQSIKRKIDVKRLRGLDAVEIYFAFVALLFGLALFGGFIYFLSLRYQLPLFVD